MTKIANIKILIIINKIIVYNILVEILTTMDYAIIEISGRQFWVECKKYYTVNHLPLKIGTKLFLKRILFINKKQTIKIGCPYLNNAQVEATILNHFQGKKILVYKMKPKKKYRKKNGHRQKLTKLLINKFTV